MNVLASPDVITSRALFNVSYTQAFQDESSSEYQEAYQTLASVLVGSLIKKKIKPNHLRGQGCYKYYQN